MRKAVCESDRELGWLREDERQAYKGERREWKIAHGGGEREWHISCQRQSIRLR